MASSNTYRNALRVLSFLLCILFISSTNPILNMNQIITSIYDLLQYDSSFDLLLNEGVRNASCAAKLFQSKSNLSVLQNAVAYSGLSVIDIGMERECKAKDMAFFFITYNMTYNKDLFLSEYFAFLEDSQFYRGICLWKECLDYIIKLLDLKNNTQLRDTLKKEGITNVSIFNYDYKDNFVNRKMAYQMNYKMISLSYVLWSLTIYFLFRIIITIMATFISNSKKEKKEDDYYDINSLDRSQSNNNNTSLLILNQSQLGSPNRSILFSICKYCSLKKSLSVIMKKQSKYYNPKDILPLNGLRFCALLLITISHNSWAICKLPHKELSSLLLYNNSFWFPLIKCGILSLESLKVINGIHFGFKFMSYVKVYSKEGVLSIMDIIRFYLKIIPSVIMFAVALFIFHFYIMEIGLSISPNISFEYYIKKSLMTNDFIQNPFNAFIPFYYQYYFDNTGSTIIMDSGLKNLFFALSEFYCFTFLCILLYLLLKIRSKFVDLIIFISNFVLFSVCYFNHEEIFFNSNYTITKVYGSLSSVFYPHIFFILYFLGFNLGVMVYYFKDIANVFDENSSYQLFRFNYTIMKKFIQINYVIKLIIFFISLLIITVIAFDYNILYAIYSTSDSILIQTNQVIKFIYIYEGQIFGVAFIVLAMILLLNSGDLAGIIKSVLGTKLFFPISRISTAFVLMDNFYVSIFHAIYSISIYMNFKNTIFISFPLFIINLLFSILMVVLFEFPIKVIYRKIFASKAKRKLSTM